MSPVPIDALERGVAELPRPGSNPARVLAFLMARPKEAWRAHEIAAALDVEPHTLGAALRRLRARGLVAKKGVHWHALGARERATLAAALALTRDLDRRLGRERRKDWAELPHE
ncbi:MAG TPA: helix-turn-helix domain-containing protein [Candidatus Thermoplasmatota archaeon]|nr:helix-turn-helix domain-containing protein [Candidatus Thermoplasmatota archaeon]